MAGQQPKKCLYEVLGVSRDSSQEEIRSAYKRLALQLHPDKLAQSGAIGGADATAAFQELLHAYEVLSDPKERVWYDSHRSQILFSDPSTTSKSRTSFIPDLFSFFSNSVYSGFTDSGKGFYKVYGDVFAKIYAQELHFTEKIGLPSDEVDPAPLIGNLDSPYAQVTAFFNYWLGFSTVMDFAWVDEYDSFSGLNRRARRLMEEENKKVRKKARREYNDTVRGLAAFVKKRDKRVLDMLMKKKKEEEKRQADEKERRKEEERKRKEKAMMYQDCEWAKNDDEQIETVWDDDNEDKLKKKGQVELYCVACNKKFKSDKQWKNHEQSKKHQEKVAELRRTFDEEEEVLMDAGQEEFCASFDYVPHAEDDESSDIDAVQLSEAFKDDFKLQEEGKDNGNINIDELSDNVEVSGTNNDNGIGDSTKYPDSKIHKNLRNRRAKTGKPDVTDDIGEINGSLKDDNGVVESNVESYLEEISNTVNEISENNKGDRVVGKSQKLKKQLLNENGSTTKKDIVPPKSSSKGKKQKGSAKAGNTCGTCEESFGSRNKLFAHLGSTGHAVMKS